MSKDEALKMAIEWAEGWYGYSPSKDALLKACRKALEQPAQEPVAFIDINWVINYTEHGVDNCYDPVFNPNGKLNVGDKLYTHPHQWQGLTDDEIEYWECLKAPPVHPDFLEDDSWREFARCIEKALKEKNT